MRHTLMGGLAGFVVTATIGAVALKAPVVLGQEAAPVHERDGGALDQQLVAVLARAGFTGRAQQTLEQRLGRPVNRRLADLGRLIFFDPILALHGDNSCAGCHSPAWGFGDSQSIAIGVDSNNMSGPDRAGARNQRRAPSVINSAFFPRQMLNGRFEALSGDPFDNSQGFRFPPPEGTAMFPPNDPHVRTLLAAQGHLPPTELVEMAGFTGTAGTIGPEFDQFDNGQGSPVPPPDGSGYRNDPIRAAVRARFNEAPAYRQLFARAFNQPPSIEFWMVAQALAEFQASLTLADAPLDRFARGLHGAMTAPQKRGALLFFGRARCIECHAVAGGSNEMFSDFQNHVIGVPQVAPRFGVGQGNVIFDGPGRDEDFGAEQVTADPADRYRFRTSPLRNVGIQPAFFHNGAFTQLDQAIRHHLDVVASATTYDPVTAGLDQDLTHELGPIQPVLDRLDPLVATPIELTAEEFADLVEFVRHGLLDPRATPHNLCTFLPQTVPSGLPIAIFQDCRFSAN